MLIAAGLMLAALLLVFIAAELFTNALEFIGERMGVSEGVTGSIFAAIGTAMPETIVPIVAILSGGASEAVNHAVGMGAILGAPFMLATLSLGLIGYFAGTRHGWHTRLDPEPSGLRRDLAVFMAGLVLIIVSGQLPPAWQESRFILALILCLIYFLHLLRTIQASRELVADGHGTEAGSPLHASRIMPTHLWSAILQLSIAMAILIQGARMFVNGAEQMSTDLGISAFVVSLLVIPVATELPEKINSILWIRRRKDTLAFGNITGAMAFQGTVIPAVGMTLMPWHIHLASHAGISLLLTLLGVAWLWRMRPGHRLTPTRLLLNGGLYLIFVVYVLVRYGQTG